jgi:hypothetical protein
MMLAAWFRAGVNKGVVALPQQRRNRRSCLLTLFNMATCGSASNDSCIGFEGGVYDPQASSTYQLTTQARWNGSQSANE